MIFVTTGTQEPFDRLIQVIDEIAPTINEKIVVQAFKYKYKARNFDVLDFIPPNQFNELIKEARLLISHAGMGTVITALTNNKPIVIMPRIARLGEHRNEHQLATAAELKRTGYVYVADNEAELKILVTDLLKKDKIEPLHHIGNFASDELISSIVEYITK